MASDPEPVVRRGARLDRTAVEAESPVAARVDSEGRRRLFMTTSVARGDVIVPMEGVLRSAPTRYSVQISEKAHLDALGPIEATNHSCEPSAFLDIADPDRISLRANRDLRVGDEVTIDYCATEEEMVHPFDCDCGVPSCRGVVKGYRFLSSVERTGLGDLVGEYLRIKYELDREPPGHPDSAE